MLLMTEERIRGGIVQAIHKYEKANDRYTKIYSKYIESAYLMYLDMKTCMDNECLKNCL